MAAVRFDTSLEAFAAAIVAELGEKALESGVIVRDGSGRLSAVLSSAITTDALESASLRIADLIGGYARPDALLRTPDSISGRRLLEERDRATRLVVGGAEIAFVDRRVVGGDWLAAKRAGSSRAKRIAFASLKGGVGRSTALCVAAIHLSLAGKRVLCIDLDLEAPGIGTMLLRREELPAYGVVDYLVENGVSGIDDKFLVELVADCRLGREGARVGVVPAFGELTLNHPQNALSKLSRAYVEDISPDGTTSSVGDQISSLIDTLDRDGAFDVILIDARAGLHELTAPIFMKLDANILLFGTDQPQTYLGYTFLLSHLKQVALPHPDEWLERIWFIHSRTAGDDESLNRAEERFSELYGLLRSDDLADASRPILSKDDFDLEWDDQATELLLSETADIIHIAEDPAFKNFDPQSNPTLLQAEAYSSTFREFLSLVDLMTEEMQEAI